MRVLLVNAFHWMKGGVERTYLDESRWLSAAGHDVAHFAVRDPRNLPSPTAAHFAPAADFTEGGGFAQIAQLPRVFWSSAAATAMASLLQDFRPEVAHLHAPSRHLTPSILEPLERTGVPVVMTLHDFKPWCTNRILFAHGAPCERCRGGRHWRAVTTGCVQGSRAKSSVGMLEAYLHDARDAYRTVRLWIAPSRFVLDKAESFGVSRQRLRHLSHGVEASAASPASAARALAQAGLTDGAAARFALFAGRLSLEKGVKLLPAIAGAIAPVPLLVAGEGPLGDWLAAQSAPTLRRLGHLDDSALAALRARAAVVVVPSLFYEHFGYTVAEALLDARPVVASRIGALPELAEHEVTGLLAEPGDGAIFAAMAKRALDEGAAARWGEAGRARVLDRADPRRHLEGLLAIYEEARDGRASASRG
ncbi:MAG: glycosyltransferase [Candidatus Eisenbacteria bacterium]